MMKKPIFLIISFLVILFVGLTFASDVHAAPIPCPISNCDLLSNFEGLTGLIRPVATFAFLGMVAYGGLVRLTAAGNEENEKKSNQILTAAVVGFIIIVLAPLIVGFVGQIFGIPNLIDTTP